MWQSLQDRVEVRFVKCVAIAMDKLVHAMQMYLAHVDYTLKESMERHIGIVVVELVHVYDVLSPASATPSLHHGCGGR